jgi:hypothetical protein
MKFLKTLVIPEVSEAPAIVSSGIFLGFSGKQWVWAGGITLAVVAGVIYYKNRQEKQKQMNS